MFSRGGRIVRGSCGHPASAGIALAALALAVAGCSQVLPLGPTPPPTVPSHLGSPIVMQLVVHLPAEPGGGCPAGYTTLPGLGIFGPEGPGQCFRKTGAPVAFDSAAVTLIQQQDGGGPVQRSAEYQVLITLPGPAATELAAINAKALGSGDQLSITIAGQTWAAPVIRPPTNGQFGIPVQSMNQALQLQRTLLRRNSGLPRRP
jgi:hypothetical protein